jgi:hypothetical protein
VPADKKTDRQPEPQLSRGFFFATNFSSLIVILVIGYSAYHGQLKRSLTGRLEISPGFIFQNVTVAPCSGSWLYRYDNQ